jgi:hypothetical protein
MKVLVVFRFAVRESCSIPSFKLNVMLLQPCGIRSKRSAKFPTRKCNIVVQKRFSSPEIHPHTHFKGQEIFIIPLQADYWAYFTETHHVSNSLTPIDSTSKLHKIVQRLDSMARKEWNELETADSKSWKGKFYIYALKLRKYIEDPSENFLRHISPSSKELLCVYPKSIPEELIRSRLFEMINNRTTYHQKYLYLSTACLPFSLLMGILPGPNVFVIYNLYRVLLNLISQKNRSTVIGKL